MSQTPIRRNAAVPEGPAAAARLLEPALAEAAGAGAEPVSLTLDYAAPVAAGASVRIEAELDRATRTLAFVYGRLLSESGAVVATGSAVFRRVVDVAGAR